MTKVSGARHESHKKPEKKQEKKADVNKKDTSSVSSPQKNNSVNKKDNGSNNKSLTQSYNDLDKAIKDTDSLTNTANITATNPINSTVSTNVNPFGVQNFDTSNVSQADPSKPDYPDRVDKIMDVDNFLDNVDVPSDVQAKGPDAVNKYKLEQLAGELHNQIYDENGEYKPEVPIDDLDAVQTIMSASSKLSYEEALKEFPMKDGDFNQVWKDKFMGYNHSAVMSQKFGDFGWDPSFQDGSETQSHHFQLAASGAYNIYSNKAFGFIPPFLEKPALHLMGNLWHEWYGKGPSKQDLYDSSFAMGLSENLARNDNYTPVDYVNDWADGTRNGAGSVLNYTDMSVYIDTLNTMLAGQSSSESDYQGLFNMVKPLTGLPFADVDQNRYPQLTG